MGILKTGYLGFFFKEVLFNVLAIIIVVDFFESFRDTCWTMYE